MSLLRKLSVERFQEVICELGVPFTPLGEQHFAVRKGSTVVEIQAEPWKARDLLISVRATVVEGAAFSEELARVLLEQNASVPFGSFGFKDGCVVFRHSLIGSTLDVKELRSAYESVSEISDDWDEKLVAIAGGARASDGERWKSVDWKESAPAAREEPETD